ncbi:MAG: adenosylmethionine decarboxylase [Pseudomonadota bacterium]
MSETHALFQLGMDLGAQHSDQRPGTAQAEEFTYDYNDFDYVPANENTPTTSSASDDRFDHFIVKDGVRFAGTHLIIDVYEAEGLDDLALMETTLNTCIERSGATKLHMHLHHFTPNDGISGVAVLAESHISVHTWPEANYAAFDVFMCGDASPHECVEVLRDAFQAGKVTVGEHKRGDQA